MSGNSVPTVAPLAIPNYLEQTYWWAYVHPKAVYVFERQWLVNLILWGNFSRLRDAALDALGSELDGRTLQIACVYGNLTAKICERLTPDARLDVVDILPVQLDNLARKLPAGAPVRVTVSGAMSAKTFEPRPPTAPPAGRRRRQTAQSRPAGAGRCRRPC